jgi:hypothetical protein
MHRLTHPTIEQGVPAARSIAVGLQAVMAPLPRGIAGWIARARGARRAPDGRFLEVLLVSVPSSSVGRKAIKEQK